MTRAEQRELEAYPVNMTPNKLYIGLEDVGSGYVFDVSLLPNGFDEYIRKDALMEWANSWLAFKRNGIVLDDGFSYAMEELIKKLNEM